MKKFISVILAMMIAMSTSIVALAAPGDPDAPVVYTDASTVDLSVIYDLLNENKTSPKEDFTFTIKKVSVSDSLETFDSMPMFDPATVTIGAAEGVAEVAPGSTLTTTVNLPTYNNVGIYTYKITQQQGNKAGVVYDANPLFLKVTVIEQDGKKRIAALHYETADGVKTQTFANQYQAGDLRFSKTVTGNMGEKDRYFQVDVTLTGEVGKTYPATLTVTGGTKIEDGIADATTSTIEIGNPKTFWIKDGETITISNIPYGVTYTVIEKDPNTTGGTGYNTPAYAYNDQGTNKVVDTNIETVDITNTKDQNIDMGVNLESLPYIALIGFAAVGLVAFVVIKKRKAAREDY